ncbi:DUF2934 domain-containing protein [Paraburkholderia fungorum]|uniref:DUF2934 domain-containing protein n=1 Tax=Paraburkholderia fungorum TaxID=134537 RepID=UPI000941F41D|nr:DUF2934 domain-containing protein [Paraburkholderia fungorum]
MQASPGRADIELRAYYLWESNGRPAGRAEEYWEKAIAMLDEESRIVAPIDEATAAGSLLTQHVSASKKIAMEDAAMTVATAPPAKSSTRRKKAG